MIKKFEHTSILQHFDLGSDVGDHQVRFLLLVDFLVDHAVEDLLALLHLVVFGSQKLDFLLLLVVIHMFAM